MMDETSLTITESPILDLVLLLSLIVCVVIVSLVINWVQSRYITMELNQDTGVSAEESVRTFVPGIPGNPTMVTFLELEFPGQIQSVMMVHRVGANVTFTDGTMQLFSRNGKAIGEPFNPDQYRAKRRAQPPI